jgi:general secretion pathway protein D
MKNLAMRTSNLENAMIRKILFVLIVLSLSLSSIVYAQEGMTIKDYLEEALPPQTGRKVVLDRTSGILTVTDTPSNHKLIRQLIKEFDVGPTQVMIEARFVEVQVSDLQELGTEFYWYQAGDPADGRIFDSLEVGDAPYIYDSTTGDQLDPTDYLTTADGIQWGDTDSAGDYTGFPQEGYGADFFIGKTGYHGNYLRAYLHALEEKGKANTLSAPKVMTMAGQMANMEVTRTFPYVSKVELENQGTADDPIWNIKTTIEEKTIGISLEVTPHVASGSKFITLDLHPEVNVLLEQQSIRPSVTTTYYYILTTGEVIPVTSTVPGIPDSVGWPTVDTRSTQTTVVTQSGRTIILGGLIREEEQITKKQVPLLGNIPLLGNLFKYKHVDRQKTNLLIFITATLISPEGKEIK